MDSQWNVNWLPAAHLRKSIFPLNPKLLFDHLSPFISLNLKAICFVISVLMIFSLRKQSIPHQAGQSWHQLSVKQNKVLVQTLFTSVTLVEQQSLAESSGE